MAEGVRIDARFEGPPGIANGGYVAGLLARRFATDAVEVTLRAPAPLGQPLAVVDTEAGVELRDADRVLASARSVELTVDVPEPVARARIEGVAGRCRALETHPFPRCFVCGPDRAPEDGLRILPGWLEDEAVVAAVWAPGSEREVAEEVIWSVLDCPSAFPLLEDPEAQKLEPMVLGRLTGRIERRVNPGELLRVSAWKLELEGRRGKAGVALHDEAGACVGRAIATWISMAGTESEFSPVRA